MLWQSGDDAVTGPRMFGQYVLAKLMAKAQNVVAKEDEPGPAEAAE